PNGSVIIDFRPSVLYKLTERFSQAASFQEHPMRNIDQGSGVSGPVQQTAPQPAAAPAADAAPVTAPVAKRRLSRKLMAVASALALTVAVGGYYGAQYWNTGRYQVSTDDAYVRVHTTTLASKIAGYVAAIPVEDNAQIHAGDVIATIDAGDYE